MGRRNRAGGGGRGARRGRPVRAARQRKCGGAAASSPECPRHAGRGRRRRSSRRSSAFERSDAHAVSVRAFGRSGVRAFGRSGVRAFGRSGVQAFGCSGVRVFGCSGVRVFGCSGKGTDAGGQRSVRQASVSGPSTHGRPIVAAHRAFRHCSPPPRSSHGPARTGGTPRAPCRHRRDARRTIQVHDSRAARAAAACCRSFLRTFLARLFCR
ncbi:LigA [Burkholderia pseudomallei]